MPIDLSCIACSWERAPLVCVPTFHVSIAESEDRKEETRSSRRVKNPTVMSWVERDLKTHLVPTHCYGQGCLPLDQVAQGLVQSGLEHLQG